MLPILLTLLLLGPWALLLAGAIRRVRRMQVEGAALLFLGSLFRWIVFSPHFGIDRYGVHDWSYWFARVESGLYVTGLLLFFLGYFLARRPCPGRFPWPLGGRIVSTLSIICFSALAWFAQRNVSLPFSDLPWSVARALFTFGFYPYAACYFARSFSAMR